MKNKQKYFLLLGFFACGLMFLGIFFRVYPSSEFPKAILANPGQVLGAQVNARGPIPETKEEPSLAAVSEKNLGKVKAKSYIMFDLQSGFDFTQKNSNDKLSIASLTKLMTAYVAYLNLDFKQTALIKPQSNWAVAPMLKIKANDAITVQDLFNSMLIGSANDAAFALAQYFEAQTNKDFVSEMNTQAKALNMVNSSFSNPAGFDSPENYSSAEDLKILATRVLKLPAFTNLSRKTNYSFQSQNNNQYRVVATNKLIGKYADILALKTGYTKGSLGSMATVVENSGRQTVIIVLDSPQRETDTLLLRQALLSQN